MSLKALFVFLAASAVAFWVQSGAGEDERTMTLGDSVGQPIAVTSL